MFRKPRKIPPQKALTICQTMCSKQEFCCFDIERKLKRWQVEPQDIKEILAKLETEKFIDETRYASAFANDKFRFGRWGRNKIKFNLKRKKVSEIRIKSALAKIDQEEYLVTLNGLLEAKKGRIKAKDDYDRKRKLAAFAIGRGFEPELVFKVINKSRIDDL
jgi:regulatory protein